MLTQEIKDIAMQIGQFFLNRNNGDYVKTEKQITDMRINNISLSTDGKLVIELSRPGLLIGRKGIQITDLTNYMGRPIHIVETMEHVYDYLVPRPYWDY